MMTGIKKWIYFLGLCGLCIQAFSITEPTQGAGRFKLVVADSEGLDVSPDFAVDFGGEQSAPVLNLQLAGDATIELS